MWEAAHHRPIKPAPNYPCIRYGGGYASAGCLNGLGGFAGGLVGAAGRQFGNYMSHLRKAVDNQPGAPKLL